ncbi:putative ribonuclease H-like domain-containing protein [Tanacetum coccineum]
MINGLGKKNGSIILEYIDILLLVRVIQNGKLLEENSTGKGWYCSNIFTVNGRKFMLLKRKDANEYLAGVNSQGDYENIFMEWMDAKEIGKPSELGLVKKDMTVPTISSRGSDMVLKYQIRMQNYKFLRSLPPAWSNLAMTMRTKPDVDTLSIDDFKRSTNKVKSGFTGAYNTCTPSTSLTNISKKEVLAGFADEVIYSLFAKQLEVWDLLHEDLEQIDDLDIEEMDINWQIAMIAYNVHKGGNMMEKKIETSFYQHQEDWESKRKNQMGLLIMDDGIVNWGEHTEVEKTNHALMAISSSNEEPKKISEALQDDSWVQAMQEELLQFKLQQVWVLVDLPHGMKVIGTKWVYRNKRDERGVVVRNKARLVAQGYTQEEDEEVYVSQPPGFVDPDHPKKVYKVVKALYGLHQAPKAWDKKDIMLDKYVAEILKKFNLVNMKTAITPMETKVALTKDEEAVDVNVHLYRSMIGHSLDIIISMPTIVATATSEAEYVAAANCYGQNPVYHSKTKHIEIRHHFIRDCYEKKLISVEKIHTDFNVADLLTKPFDGPRFNYLVVCRDSRFSRRFQPQASIRNKLQLADASGITMLPNNEIFEGMGHIRNMKRGFKGALRPLLPVMLLVATTNPNADQAHPDSGKGSQANQVTAWGSDIVKCQEVMKLEGMRKREKCGLSDSDEKNCGCRGGKSQDDPLASFGYKGWSIPSKDYCQCFGWNSKREGKAPMIIEEAPKKSKEQILQEEASLAEAIRLDTLEKKEEAKQKRIAQVQFEAPLKDEDWDLIRAKIEANAELSKCVLGSDLQGEDFAKKMIELNQGTWKLSQLKNLSFEEVKEEFDKLVKQVESFAPINFEATKDSLKRFGEELQTKTSKRLKSDEAKEDESTKKTGKRRKQIARKGLHSDKADEDESEDSKDDDPISGTNIPINPVPVAIKPPSIATYKIIKQGEKGVYQIVREDGTDIVYINFGAMLKDITRDDLTELYRIVMNRYGMNGPEDELEKIKKLEKPDGIAYQTLNWMVSKLALGSNGDKENNTRWR